MKKSIIVSVVVLVVVTGVSYIHLRNWNKAIVNGQGISRKEYVQNLENQIGKQTLDMMVQNVLIEQEAKKNKIVISQKEIDDQIASIEEKLKAQNQTLDEALSAQGMTKAILMQQIRLQKSVAQLVKVSENVDQAKIDEFLKTNKTFLPTGKTKKELEEIAKTELLSQEKSTAITTWLDNLTKNAKVVVRP